MKKNLVLIAIACSLLLLICISIITYNSYIDRQGCACSILTAKEQTFTIDDRLYRVCEKDTMSAGTFMYVRTECDHGKRLHLTVHPDQGIYTGFLIEE